MTKNFEAFEAGSVRLHAGKLSCSRSRRLTVFASMQRTMPADPRGSGVATVVVIRCVDGEIL